MRLRTILLRLTLGLVVLAAVLYALERWSGIRAPVDLAEPLLALGVILAFVALTIPARDPVPARTPSLHVRKDGSFVWEPAQPALPKSGATRHLWIEPTYPRHLVRLAFELPDENVGAPLHKATKAGLRAARRSLPGRGRVRVVGHVRDERGPTSRASVTLDIEAAHLEEGSARTTSEAFARAFLDALPDARLR